MSPTTSHADPTSELLDWLASPPPSDLTREASQLGMHLDMLQSPNLASAQFHRCVELFHSRALRLCAGFREEMRGSSLPLPAERARTTRLIAEAVKRIAAGFERVIGDARAGAIRPQRHLLNAASANALNLLGELYVIVSQAGMAREPALWSLAYRFLGLSGGFPGSSTVAASASEPALSAFKRLLALVALDPLSLSPAELDWAADFLSHSCALVHIQNQAPAALNGAWFWLDPESGAEPVACVRQQPPESRKCLYFSTYTLGRRAAESLARYEGGHTDTDLEPSARFPGVQPAALLARLRQRWTAPSRRQQPRRRQRYPVEACVGLSSIWEMLWRRSPDTTSLISHWNVFNESPGGYAILHLLGSHPGLTAGTAVALRRQPEDPWNICLVRWVRCDADDEVEIGLQVVSRGAVPVRVGFKGGARGSLMSKALTLPILPVLRQHQAIMTATGTYDARRFVLVSDIDRIYVAECRLLSLDMQTASTEVFQFEVDAFPT